LHAVALFFQCWGAGVEIELSDFEAEHAMLQGEYPWQVVEIVIEGVSIVLEVRFMYLFMSLSRIVLQGSRWMNLFDPMRLLGNLKSASNSLEISISWLMKSRQAFISRCLLDGVQVSAFHQQNVF
jgi:hypothetical protein